MEAAPGHSRLAPLRGRSLPHAKTGVRPDLDGIPDNGHRFRTDRSAASFPLPARQDHPFVRRASLHFASAASRAAEAAAAAYRTSGAAGPSCACCARGSRVKSAPSALAVGASCCLSSGPPYWGPGRGTAGARSSMPPASAGRDSGSAGLGGSARSGGEAGLGGSAGSSGAGGPASGSGARVFAVGRAPSAVNCTVPEHESRSTRFESSETWLPECADARISKDIAPGSMEARHTDESSAPEAPDG